ncbi:hypothetical protein JCM17960_25500 [Magnetospira thiophila]
MADGQHVYPQTVWELQAEISARAYEIWEEEGRQPDQGLKNWERAEAEILALKDQQKH